MTIPLYTLAKGLILGTLFVLLGREKTKDKKFYAKCLFYLGALAYVYFGHQASLGKFDADFVGPSFSIDFPGFWISQSGTNQVIFLIITVYLIITGFNWLKKSGKF